MNGPDPDNDDFSKQSEEEILSHSMRQANLSQAQLVTVRLYSRITAAHIL